MTRRGRGVVKQYALDRAPGGLAVGPEGMLYVGIPDSQSILVIDPASDRIMNEVILDDPEIAATKELVTIRVDEKRNRLVIAQGSDESVTILGLPGLEVEREITLEGESIRDAIPDPLDRYLFVLGRDVHVFDAAGRSVIRTIRDVDPMSIAVSSDGEHLAVVGSEEFAAGQATVVSLWALGDLREISRDPLQTEREIRASTFAAGDRVLVAVADDWLGEKSVVSTRESARMVEDESGQQRIEFQFGDLVSSETVCLAEAAGAQALETNRAGSIVYFPERRCSSGGSFIGSKRRVAGASLYAVNGRAVVRDPKSDDLWVSSPDGTVTLYRAPKPRKQ